VRVPGGQQLRGDAQHAQVRQPREKHQGTLLYWYKSTNTATSRRRSTR
jgi:hypothetical protein